MVRIERSREIFLSQFANSKIQNGSKFLVKMHVTIIMKSLHGVLNLVYYYRIL